MRRSQVMASQNRSQRSPTTSQNSNSTPSSSTPETLPITNSYVLYSQSTADDPVPPPSGKSQASSTSVSGLVDFSSKLITTTTTTTTTSRNKDEETATKSLEAVATQVEPSENAPTNPQPKEKPTTTTTTKQKKKDNNKQPIITTPSYKHQETPLPPPKPNNDNTYLANLRTRLTREDDNKPVIREALEAFLTRAMAEAEGEAEADGATADAAAAVEEPIKILHQLRWLDYVSDPRELAEQLLEVLTCLHDAKHKLFGDAVSCIPEIIGEREHSLAAEYLVRWLRTSKESASRILDTLADLSIPEPHRGDAVSVALNLLKSANVGDTPVVVRFLIRTLASTPINSATAALEVRRTLNEMRASLNALVVVSPSPSARAPSSKSNESPPRRAHPEGAPSLSAPLRAPNHQRLSRGHHRG